MKAYRFLITHKIVVRAGVAIFLGSAVLVLNHSQANSSADGNSVTLKPLTLPASDSSGIAARDAQRISDLQQIRNELEYYFYECGYYPGTSHAKQPCGPYVANNTWAGLSAALTNSAVRIANIPNDPTTGASYVYSAAAGGIGYVIGAALEDPTNPALNQSVHGVINKVNCESPMYCIQL